MTDRDPVHVSPCQEISSYSGPVLPGSLNLLKHTLKYKI